MRAEQFQDVISKIRYMLSRYSLVLCMALLCAVSAICYIHQSGQSGSTENFVFLKLELIFALGISVLFGVKMLSDRWGQLLPLQLGALAFLFLYYLILPDSQEEFTEVYAYLLIPTFILSHLMVAFLPFLCESASEARFWQYNKNLFLNTFLTGVFTVILTSGMMLAILAMDHLFDLNIKSDYYLYTFSFLSIFGSCVIFLLFNAKGLSFLEKGQDYPTILKFFTQYILIPLLIIYAFILYFYGLKILMQWELPRGWVSYLIIAYSLVGILATLLVYPLKENNVRSWVPLFSRIFYYTVLPLLVLLFTAIFTRILQYGYTELRYFVLIIALWLSVIVVYFIFIKNAHIKFVPLSLFIFGIASLTLPGLNAFSVATRSQKNELMAVLEQQQILKNGEINFKKPISGKTAEDISSKLSYLAIRNEDQFVLKLLPDSVKTKFKKEINAYAKSAAVENQFTNITPETALESSMHHTLLTSPHKSENIAGYRYLLEVRKSSTTFTVDNQNFTFVPPGDMIELEFPVLYNKERLNKLAGIEKLFNENKSNPEKADLTFVDTIGSYQVKFIFSSLSRSSSAKGKDSYIITGDSYFVLIR